MAAVLRLFDTASGEVAPLRLREPGRVSMYVCGLTVDAAPHIGHGRFALVYDVLRRYLTWSGLDVTYVSNVTDIDDKIIARARREGRTEAEVAAEFGAAVFDALDALGIARPDHSPHATDYVAQMVDLVGRLVDAGLAYVLDDGVYLETARVPGYGLLARQSLDDLRSGVRIEVGADKRSPLDFVLWKSAKPDEPSWPSPWGDGRPGWHTECVVMALDLLGEGFDLHGGGLDLRFPHHENERAQAVALGCDFARHWVHNGMVESGGQKMSKSLGNVTGLLDLVGRHDPRAYRLLVLQAHYRSPLVVTEATLSESEAALGRLDAFARNTAHLAGPGVDPDAPALDRFRAAMDDDLDTPGATAALFDTVRGANTALAAGDGGRAGALAAAVRAMLDAVGLTVAVGEEAPADVVELARRRGEARAGRDFALADALRDDITAAGWVVEDGAAGSRLHRP